MIQKHLSNTMDNVSDNIDDYNPNRETKILVAFDYMIADIMTNKKFQAVVKEQFIRCRKLNISHVFNTQFYFSVPKDVLNFKFLDLLQILNSTHYLITKIYSK